MKLSDVQKELLRSAIDLTDIQLKAACLFAELLASGTEDVEAAHRVADFLIAAGDSKAADRITKEYIPSLMGR